MEQQPQQIKSEAAPSVTSETEPESISDSATKYYDLEDFVEAKHENPFFDEFREEDLFKAGSFIESNEDAPSKFDEPELLESEDVIDQGDATPNAWDNRKGNKDRSEAMKRIQSDSETSSDTDSSTSSESDPEKVKLAEKTSKIATRSLAKQSAKLFEWVSELAVKKYSKVSDKKLEGMEEKGLLDRSYILPNGQTVAELIEDHNSMVDELVSTDEDTREELTEALMLVAQKHKIEVSPEANLAMVVITMLIGLAKAGHDQKKIMDKTLRKISDTYIMQKRTLVEAQDRAEIAENRLANLQNNGMPAPSEQSMPPENPSPILESAPRNLSFNTDETKRESKKSLTIVKDEVITTREVKQAESELDEIDSFVEGDTRMSPKKPKVVKRLSKKAPVRKISTKK